MASIVYDVPGFIAEQLHCGGGGFLLVPAKGVSHAQEARCDPAKKIVSVRKMLPDETEREDKARLAAQAEQIGRLVCRVDQLEREKAELVRRLGDGERSFAGRSEAELVSRAIPGRALRYGF